MTDNVLHKYRSKYLRDTSTSSTANTSSTFDSTKIMDELNLLKDWFYKDEDGNVHSKYSFVGDISVNALGKGSDTQESKYGVLIADLNGKLYTLAEWIEQSKDNDDALAVVISTEDTCFGINIDAIANTFASASGSGLVYSCNWSSTSVLLTTIPENGASATTAQYYNDGYNATIAILAEIGNATASKNAMATKLQVGTEQKNGFLGSFGQWQLVEDNYSTIQQILRTVRPNASEYFSYYRNGYFWSSTQYSTTNVWCFGRANGNYNKTTQKYLLPFYKFSNGSSTEGGGQDLSNYYTKTEIDNKGFLTEHQPLKTINNQSLIGNGNITIGEGGTSYDDTELRGYINELSGNSHTHSNKTVLDNLTQTVIDNSHTHTNKTVIDGITSTKVSNWDTASTNTHTHSNKTVLDNVTQTQIDFIVSLMNIATIDANGNITFTNNVISQKGITALETN